MSKGLAYSFYFLKLRGYSHNIKLAILKEQFSDFRYIHNGLQQPPLSSFKTVQKEKKKKDISSPQKETTPVKQPLLIAPSPDTSCKWHQTIHDLLYLTSFTWHHVFRVLPAVEGMGGSISFYD